MSRAVKEISGVRWQALIAIAAAGEKGISVRELSVDNDLRLPTVKLEVIRLAEAGLITDNRELRNIAFAGVRSNREVKILRIADRGGFDDLLRAKVDGIAADLLGSDPRFIARAIEILSSKLE
jgi:DNA-binding transcriptional ArsR family regulator